MVGTPGRIADVAFALSGGDRPLADVCVEVTPLVAAIGAESHRLAVPAERVRAVVCAYRPKGGLGGPADWDAPGSYDYIPYLLLYDAGLIDAVAVPQLATFDAAVQFPRQVAQQRQQTSCGLRGSIRDRAGRGFGAGWQTIMMGGHGR